MSKTKLNESQIEIIKEALRIIENQEKWAEKDLKGSQYARGVLMGIRLAKYAVLEKYKYDLAPKVGD